MSELDFLYRAFANYRQQTQDNRESHRFRDAVISSCPQNDAIVVNKVDCHIDSDWIEALEKGLPFYEKAIAEERQFIRNNGEVVPIEKARSTSKESVVDLAKHSNFITHLPQSSGGAIIPDKILMVEKLSDYAVYENRVLYSALLYLEDFIQIRYNKLKELAGRYAASLRMDKKIALPSRRLSFSLSLSEERHDDPIAMQRNSFQRDIERIGDCLSQVESLLRTPLMREVSKASLVKPPIVETNVLKMDRNFKECVTLYHYVLSYTKEGFAIKEEKKTISPFCKSEADEFAELVSLASFLTYQDANGIANELKASYEEEEKRRKKEEEKRFLDQLNFLKSRVKTNDLSVEKYALLLEKGTKILNDKLVEKDEKLVLAAQKKQEMEREYQASLVSLKREQVGTIEKLRQKESEDLEEAKKEQEKALSALKATDEATFAALKAGEEEKFAKQAHDSAVILAVSHIKQVILESRYERLEAETNGYKAVKGELSEPITLTNRSSFQDLERQKIAFDKYYAETWKLTKKSIRQKAKKEVFLAWMKKYHLGGDAHEKNGK